MSSIVTEREYEIQYYEIDYKKRSLITSIMNYLEDVAMRQSEELGVGLEYLKQNGITWVLYKWNIHIDRYPLFGEKIKIRTSAHSLKKFYAYRTFEIIDSNEKNIGWANSVWFLIDIEKRKAIRIKDEMYDVYGVDKSKNETLDIGKIKPLENIHNEKTLDVRYSDIDTNQHVNNVKYLEWAIETVPLDIITSNILKSTKIAYVKEAIYGETIKVLTEIKHNGIDTDCIHKIIDKDNKELALLETYWTNEECC